MDGGARRAAPVAEGRLSAPDARVAPRPALRRIPEPVHGGPSGAESAGPSLRADFSTSVNAYGPAPSVTAAVRAALDVDGIAGYPDPTCRAARAALAARADVSTESVAVGAGATELILAVAQAFVRAGDRVLLPPHAFAEYERATMIAGGSVVAPIGQSSPWPPDAPVAEVVAGYVRAVGSRAPRVAFLCTPESPSGRAWPLDAVREVAEACRRAGTLLVLDQSFDAFTAAPLGTPALRDHPATLHLRSLTKDHALAGVRLGYLVGLPALVGAVERARMPWSVSAPAQAAAVAVCAVEAEAHVRETTMRLRAAAEELRVAACHLGIPAVPSSAHYFLLDVGDAGAATCTLRQRHAISVRDCTSFGLHGHVRVAARTPGDNRLLLAALRALGATTSNVARPRLTAPRLMSDVSDPTRPAEESPEPAAPGRRRPPRPKQKQPGPYRVPPRERRHGLLIVNTGHGKGKTTAALGILLRAAGRGMRVGMFQFIKSAKNPYGEHTAAALLGVEIVPLGDGFTWLSENIAEDRALAERGWERCREALARGEYDVLILDELTYALKYGWLDTDAVIAAIRARPVGTHVVVTGRDAPDALVAAADLVTEMRLVKHPYREQGIGAQPGIEL